MTRRSGKNRTTPQDAPGPGVDLPPTASLRKRRPLAFWLALVGVAAMVLSTVASLLRVIL